MTAHVIFAAMDDAHPATQSRAVLDGLLRQRMGFDGLIITDALDMSAATRNGEVEGVRAALEAGADLALLGHLPNQLAMIDALAGVTNAEATRRIDRARRALPTELPSLDVVGCAEHWQIAQEIADRSITLVVDNGRLPLRVTPDSTIAVVTIRPIDLTPADTSSSVRPALAQAVEKRHSQVIAFEIPFQASPDELHAVLEATRSADTVIVGTISAPEDASQAALVKALHGRGQSPIVVSMRTPYDISAFPMIETYVCAYSIRAVTCEAVARVLFGEIAARGVLPCSISGIEETGMLL